MNLDVVAATLDGRLQRLEGHRILAQADGGLSGGQVDLALQHAGLLEQRSLDPLHARTAGHARYVEAQLLLACARRHASYLPTNRAIAATISSTLASPSPCSKLSRRQSRACPSSRPTPTALRADVAELSW